MRFLLALVGACLLLVIFAGLSMGAKREEGQEPHYVNGEHNEVRDKKAYKDLPPAELVEAVIADHAVAVFSKSYCPYSKRAKKLLEDENITFEAVELDQHPQGAEIQDVLRVKSNQRTVPNIFINGRHVGGSDALAEAKSNGRLAAMLALPRWPAKK